MANLIKIKRSTGTASPPQLSNGEMAWTESGNVVFIGSYDGTRNVPIAGARTPGTLTANQAIVVNSTSMIDAIRVGDSSSNIVLLSTGLTIANTTNTVTIVPPSTSEKGGNYFLKADGSWSTVNAGSAAAGGSNTTIQFNDSGTINGDAQFVWDKVAEALTVGNSTVNVVANSTGLSFNGGSVVVNNSLLFTGNSTVNSTINSISYALNGITFANSSTFIMGAFTANNTLVNTAAINVTGRANVATFFATTSANVGSNVQLTTAALGIGNTVANLTANSILVKLANSTSVANLTPASLTIGGTVVNASQITVASGPTINATTISTTDLIATGNLTVSGTLTTINTTNLSVSDPLLFLADNGANQALFSDSLDMGFVGQYGNTSQTQYSGFFRDASSTGKLWKLLDSTGATPAPTTTFDTSNTSFAYGILQAYLKVSGNVQGDGSGVFTANASGINAVANSSWYFNMVANTLTLSTALGGTSGGTGKATVGSQSILVGNSTNGYDEVTFTAGSVLQSNSTAVFWSNVLDGGTF